MASISTTYGTKQRFLARLVLAELNARAEWECELTDTIRARFEQAGTDAEITKAERRQLKNLANFQ